MNRPSQRGFNLIDIMIGLAISLFGLLAVSKVLMDFNQQRNTTAQTMEAQNNGVMALYLLERDLGQAGYGLMSIQDCTQINWYNATNGGAQTPLSILPVQIADGGTGNSDSMLIQYGGSSQGLPLVQASGNQAVFGANIGVTSPVGTYTSTANPSEPKPLIVADVAGVCTLYQVTDPTIVGSLPIAAAASSYNAAASPGAGWPLVQATNTIAILGTFTSKTYDISNGNLRVGAFPSAYSAGPPPAYSNPTTLVDGIVLLKAQYGLDANGDGTVDSWAGGGTAINNTTARPVAVRVGIVARSPLYEKDAVDAPTLLCVLPGTVTGTCDSGSAGMVQYTVPDAHYRYKVYYTIIPLRNVIWG